MDTSNHYELQTLFDQLGLPSQTSQINAFIHNHSIPAQLNIAQANFWTAAQSCFISEALAQDADWTELIDHLDVQLRK